MSFSAPQSDTKYLLKPQSFRSMSVSTSLAHVGSPFKQLYAPITDSTSASFTSASNAGR